MISNLRGLILLNDFFYPESFCPPFEEISIYLSIFCQQKGEKGVFNGSATNLEMLL